MSEATINDVLSGRATTTALAPWFGSNRMLASHVGDALKGCRWVGVPFAGGMCELWHITAPSIAVNDLHRHVINLARVVGHPMRGQMLIKRLRRLPFHPDMLEYAQTFCSGMEATDCETDADFVKWAEQYFVCCWMGRSHKSGIDDEFNGGLSVRWNGNGGDSNTRYRSAVRSLAEWGRIMRRCNFTVMDAFEFLARCEDEPKHGIYCDPPFLKAGRRYKHNAGQTEAEEQAWHARLRDALVRFSATRVVCRFYDHPLIRELYPASRWEWREIKGRKQSNEAAPEVLLINSRAQRGLFDSEEEVRAAEGVE